jgi:hypothetical protein
MADCMQTNINTMRAMLHERQDYAGVNELLAWMATDACDWAAWPKVMRLALCKVPSDFRDYLAAPMANAMQDISLGRKVNKQTIASLRNRMSRCSWAT